MKFAVVILNWNGKDLLKQFLPKVIAYSNEAKIYMADNASTDDSVNYCKTNFPEKVTVLVNKSNGGYAKGYNAALAQIEADVFVLLNSDVAVTKDWLTPFFELFENPIIGAAQPKIKDINATNCFEYAGAAGGYLDKFGYPYCRGRIFDTLEKDLGQYDDNVPLDWASGACLFVRASVFWEAGAFDEDYFAHHEEIDLCQRISRKGYQIWAMGNSEIYHLGGATLSNYSSQKTFFNFRNSLYNLVKHTSGVRVFYVVFFRMILDGVQGLRFLFRFKLNHFFAILRAHFSFYLNLPSLLRKRNFLNQNFEPYQKNRSNLNERFIVWDYFVKGKKLFTDSR